MKKAFAAGLAFLILPSTIPAQNPGTDNGKQNHNVSSEAPKHEETSKPVTRIDLMGYNRPFSMDRIAKSIKPGEYERFRYASVFGTTRYHDDFRISSTRYMVLGNEIETAPLKITDDLQFGFFRPAFRADPNDRMKSHDYVRAQRGNSNILHYGIRKFGSFFKKRN